MIRSQDHVEVRDGIVRVVFIMVMTCLEVVKTWKYRRTWNEEQDKFPNNYPQYIQLLQVFKRLGQIQCGQYDSFMYFIQIFNSNNVNLKNFILLKHRILNLNNFNILIL